MVAIVTGAALGVERSSAYVLGSKGQVGDASFNRYGENVYVNAATGNLVISRTDEILIGIGPDDVLTRTYNSQRASLHTPDPYNHFGSYNADGISGDNWQLNASRRIDNVSGTRGVDGSTVTLCDWDGSDIVFTCSGGVYTSKEGSGAIDTLVWDGAHTWTFTDGNTRVTDTFNQNKGGRITKTIDADGNALSYAYDTSNRLISVTTDNGESTNFTWNGSNNLTSIVTKDSTGATLLTRVTYTYDTSNRLITVRTDLSPQDNSTSDNNYIETAYTYDGTSDRIASLTQTGGGRLEFTYDGSNRVATFKETTAAGVTRTTGFVYTDGTHTAVNIVGQPSDATTTLTFDAKYELTQLDLPPSITSGSHQSLQFSYDADGNVTSTTDGSGNQTKYVYWSGTTNVKTVCDAEGNTIDYTYGTKNEVLTETRYLTPDGDKDPTSNTQTPGQPLTTYYAYDSENHLRFTVSPEGLVTEYRYAAWGGQSTTVRYGNDLTDSSVIFSVSSLGSDATTWATTINTWAVGRDQTTVMRSSITDDDRGNLSSTTDYSATDSTGAGLSPYSRVLYSFDQYGNMLTRQTPGMNTEQFTFDGLGRVITSVDLNGATTITTYDDAHNTVKLELGPSSNPHFVRLSTYNLSGQLVSYYAYNSSDSSVVTPETDYTYDALGRLRMVKDGAGNRTHYLYDGVGRRVAEILGDGSMTEYTYDASDRVSRTIHYATKANLSLLADGSGNPLNVTVADVRPGLSTDTNDPDVWEWRVYDAANRLTEVIQGDGSATAFTYDGVSDLTTTTAYANLLSVSSWKSITGTIPVTVQTPTTDSTRDQVTRNFYNADERLVGSIDGAGYLTEIRYDEAGQKNETIQYWNKPTTTTGAFSAVVGSVSADTTHDIHRHFVYDGRGYLLYELDPNLRVTQYSYDGTGNVTSRTEYKNSITSTTQYSKAYVDGQVAASGFATSDDRSTWSVYDLAHRVAFSINANGDVTAYSYDSFGRLAKETQVAVTRTTTSLPTLTTMNTWLSTNASGSDRVTRTYYDLASRAVYRVDGENYVTEYQYDGLQRVQHEIRYDNPYATISDGDSPSAIATKIGSGAGNAKTTYVYDAAGRLSSEILADGVSEASTTSYLYDGIGNVTQQTDGRGYITTYAHDTTGNVKGITTPIDSSTTATTNYDHDAFGNVMTTTYAGSDAPVSYTFYDKLNRVIEQIDPYKIATVTNYTAFGDVASVTHYWTAITGTITAGGTPPAPTTNSSKDETTSFTYDKRGLLLSTQDAMLATETYQYNTFGERSQFSNKLATPGVTTYAYDKLGQLISETFSSMTSTLANGSTEASSVTNKYEYDSRGNRTKTTEAFGLADERVTNFAYDKVDRLTTTTHEAVAVIKSDLTSDGTISPTETIAYDSRGNVIQTTDAMGAKTFFYYDDLNRKTWEINALGTVSGWVYNNDTTEVRVYANAVTLPSSPGGTCPSPSTPSDCRLTTYAYDRAGRLTTTTVASLLTGEFGTAYGTTTGNVTITNTYDLRGNVIKQTDGRGNDVFFYYDKMNRKIAQVDQEKYLTKYDLDFDGNVVTETRYAAQYTGTVTTGTPPTVTADSTNDRVTTFTYDQDGRRLTESRANVKYYAVNTGSGALGSQLTGTSTITYSYNALGEVTKKAEATDVESGSNQYLDYTTYDYDAYGRQTTVTKAAFDDYRTGTTTYADVVNQYYDGLNNLVRTFEGDQDTTITADRITTFTYDSAGRLASTTDASGFTHNYSYDRDGRVILDSYTRTKSDGTTVTEGAVTNYDLLGRVVLQSAATLSGSTWTMGDKSQTQYNVYGDVSARGANGLWQETYQYDAGGRMWKSTAGDGSTRIYLYDKNGMQTLTISSSGAALSGTNTWANLTVDGTITLLTNNHATGVSIGQYAATGMVVTIAINDKRGQNIQTIEPLRMPDGSTTTTIVHGRLYNAFGEITEEIDPRAYTSAGALSVTNPTDSHYNDYRTSFTYSTLGRVIQQLSPTVSYTDESGTAHTGVRPAQNTFYDLSGRLVGTQDANGNVNTRTLLAGTGHGGKDDEAKVRDEFHADTGHYVRQYDVFGDLRTEVDEVGKTETLIYDKMGRLIEQDHQQHTDGTQLKDHYIYDGLGRRIQHWNSQYSVTVSGVTTPTYIDLTDYDAQGRIIKSTQAAAVTNFSTGSFTGGDTTSYAYSWSATIATSGLGTFGGWTKTTTGPAQVTTSTYRDATETTDYFGRNVDRQDFSSVNSDNGNHYTFTFDLAGHTLSQTVNSTTTTSYTYFNTGFIASEATGSLTSSYKYDVAGNRTFEGYQSGSTWYEYAVVQWDAMNRMTSLDDNGAAASTGTPAITWKYDLDGNIRNMHAVYNQIDDNGNTITGTDLTQDYWYKYDSMNRFVLTKGNLVSGVIQIGTGLAIAYDAAGRRASTQKATYDTTWIDHHDDDQHYTYSTTISDLYSYSEDGYLAKVQTQYDYTGHTPTGTADHTYDDALYTRDALGRVTDYKEYNDVGTMTYRRQVIKADGSSGYDAASKVLRDVVSTLTSVATTDYDYLAETTAGSNTYTGAYQGGVVTHTHSYIQLGSDHKNSDQRNTYVWWDQAQIASQDYDDQIHEGATYPWHSVYLRDALGQIYHVDIDDGRPRDVDFVNDADGRVLTRHEDETGREVGDPVELHYYFNGMAVGDVSNNGTSDIDYAASIAEHLGSGGATGPFRNGADNAHNVQYADFDQSYDPINGLNYEGAASHYTAADGDTLQSIAYSLWGDQSFWYMLADANGMDGSETLVAGQDLIVPNKVHNAHNSADVYRVYDPNEALGNTSPTSPKPQKHTGDGNCGGFGAVIVSIISLAVAMALPFALPAVFGLDGALGGGIVAGMAAAAVGSAVGQGVGVLTGIQSKFDWGAVAMSAISAGVSAGLGDVIKGTGFLEQFARGALGSAITQGVGVATGLQKKFDWASVAAAGIGAGVGGFVGEQIGYEPGVLTGANLARGAISSFAGAIAGAATATLINGRDFGDNLISELPGVIGQTIGNAVAGGISEASSGDGDLKTASEIANADPSLAGSFQSNDRVDSGTGPIILAALQTNGNQVMSDVGSSGGISSAGVEADLWAEFLKGPLTARVDSNLPWVAQQLTDTLENIPGLEYSGPRAGIFNLSIAPEKFDDWVTQALNNHLLMTLPNGGISSNRGVFSAADSVVDRHIGSADFNAPQDIREAMLKIAQPLARIRIADSTGDVHEAFVTMGRDANGSPIVTSVQIMGSHGGPPILPDSTVAIAHVHNYGSPQPPHGADHSAAIYKRLSSFEFSHGGTNVWEIGRQGGIIQIRRVLSPTSFDAWEPYQVHPERYNQYSPSRYRAN